jgi:hypothetical protein
MIATGKIPRGDKTEEMLTFLQVIRRVAKIHALMCLIGQGLFGSRPWDCMSFILLLLDWSGYTREQIVFLQLCKGISSMVSGALGAILDDHFATRFSRQGRMYLAITSKVGGIILCCFIFYKLQLDAALGLMLQVTRVRLIESHTS